MEWCVFFMEIVIVELVDGVRVDWIMVGLDFFIYVEGYVDGWVVV